MASKKHRCDNDCLIAKADTVLLKRRVAVLEAQVQSLQMSAPRGIENMGLATLCANQVADAPPNGPSKE